MIDALENWDVEHNNAVIQRSLGSALNALLAPNLSYKSGDKIFFRRSYNSGGNDFKIVIHYRFSGCARHCSQGNHWSICCQDCEVESGEIDEELGLYSTLLSGIWFELFVRRKIETVEKQGAEEEDC